MKRGAAVDPFFSIQRENDLDSDSTRTQHGLTTVSIRRRPYYAPTMTLRISLCEGIAKPSYSGYAPSLPETSAP